MLKQYNSNPNQRGTVLEKALEEMGITKPPYDLDDTRKLNSEAGKIAKEMGVDASKITIQAGVSLSKLNELGVVIDKEKNALGMKSSGTGISIGKQDKLDIRIEKDTEGKEFIVCSVTTQINKDNKFKQEFAFVDGQLMTGRPEGLGAEVSQGELDLKKMGFRFGTLNGKSAILGVNKDGNPVALTIDKGDQMSFSESINGKVKIKVSSTNNGLTTEQYFDASKGSDGKFVIQSSWVDKSIG
jgi:hypothetical protein